MFIVFEGGAGSGKSTQIRLLVKALESKGFSVQVVKDPGTTELGTQVGQLTKSVPHGELGTRAEALLYLAARANLVEKIIRPALAKGTVIVSDRFGSTTLAYQGYGGGLDIDELRNLNQWATGDLFPALTIYLDIPVEEGLARQAQGGDAHYSQVEFRRRIRQGYLELAGQEGWWVIDAQQPELTIHQAILDQVLQAIAEEEFAPRHTKE